MQTTALIFFTTATGTNHSGLPSVQGEMAPTYMWIPAFAGMTETRE